LVDGCKTSNEYEVVFEWGDKWDFVYALVGNVDGGLVEDDSFGVKEGDKVIVFDVMFEVFVE